MRVAIAGVLTKRIETHPFGGTEAFTYLLIKGLVEQGHDVTLYSAKGSRTDAQTHISICTAEEAMINASNVEFVYPYTLLQIRKIIEDMKSKQFDILHINALKTFMFTYFTDRINLPILHTIHRDFFEKTEIAKMYERIGIKDHEYFCFVSEQAYNKSLIKKNTHFIHNGIDLDCYPFSPQTSFDTYIWLSRIDPLKGPHIAIQAVKKVNGKIIISGDIDRKKYEVFFQKDIKPYINNTIIYEPAKGYERKLELFQKGKAFIFPIQWEEPFGLVVVEALSTGTPVIAFKRGALPEIIEDGVTGFLVNPDKGTSGIVSAIKKLESLSQEDYLLMRKKCRKSVQERFSYRIMAKHYIKLYSSLITSYGQA